jgi:hypothetical protein
VSLIPNVKRKETVQYINSDWHIKPNPQNWPFISSSELKRCLFKENPNLLCKGFGILIKESVAAVRINQKKAILQQLLLYVERINCRDHIIILESYQSAIVYSMHQYQRKLYALLAVSLTKPLAINTGISSWFNLS